MKRNKFSLATLTIAIGVTAFGTVESEASLIGVSGGLSSGAGSGGGTSASIIAAPSSVTNAQVTNQAQQGFDELQNVILAADLLIDGGSIAAGTLVSSHMIFLNSAGGGITHNGVTWTFSGSILGVMSDSSGNLEAASTAILGAPGSVYQAPFNARGMESADSYSLSGNSITVNMGVTQPGDWIRVVTSSVPDGGQTLMLFGLALSGVGFARRFFT